MNYQEQLLDSNWKNKRNRILIRDSNKCQNCFNTKIINLGIPALIVNKFDNHQVSIFDITNRKTTFAELFDSSYNHQKYTGVICFYIQSMKRKIIIGITGHTIINQNKGFSYSGILNDDLESKNKLEDFFYSYYNVEEAKNFLIKKSKSQIEWKYIFNLHVHHKYYRKGLLAWEYPDEALITLCWDCHEALHENSVISEFDKFGNILENKIPCSKCYGAGWFPQFSHVDYGVCFQCSGNRFM